MTQVNVDCRDAHFHQRLSPDKFMCRILISFSFAMTLALLPVSSASAAAKGCCSHHGGPGSCTAAGVYQCKDGSTSSCKCEASETTDNSTQSSSVASAAKSARAKDTSAPTQGGACCKHCSTGKPCGDSCISAKETCHKTGGCAC